MWYMELEINLFTWHIVKLFRVRCHSAWKIVQHCRPYRSFRNRRSLAQHSRNFFARQRRGPCKCRRIGTELWALGNPMYARENVSNGIVHLVVSNLLTVYQQRSTINLYFGSKGLDETSVRLPPACEALSFRQSRPETQITQICPNLDFV